MTALCNRAAPGLHHPEQKRRLQKRAALLLLSALSCVLLLAGCKSGKDLPFYRFMDDKTPTLTVDGIRYIEDIDVIHDRTNRTGLFWKFIGEVGDPIGVCGASGEESDRFKICRIEGDEEQNFLYIMPNQFVIGPYCTYFCAREDLQMRPPSAETVSLVTLWMKDVENTSPQVDDPDMIAALLEAFHGDSIQAPTGQDWVYSTLTLQHKDFPFLQCEISCYYSQTQGISCCQNTEGEWFLLPSQWSAVFSEYHLPT